MLQCLGWAIFELIVIATAAAALSDRVFGFARALAVEARRSARSTTALALLGPVGFVRRFVRKFGSGSCSRRSSTSTWWMLDGARTSARSGRQPGQGGVPFWHGVDLVIAITVSWLPLAADYTRFSRDRAQRRSGARASATSCPTSGCSALGAILLLSRALADPPSLS